MRIYWHNDGVKITPENADEHAALSLLWTNAKVGRPSALAAQHGAANAASLEHDHCFAIVNAYVNQNWSAVAELDAENVYVVTVKELPDFRFYCDGSDRAQLPNWTRALRVHLMGYLTTGRAIPLPGASVPMTTASSDPLPLLLA